MKSFRIRRNFKAVCFALVLIVFGNQPVNAQKTSIIDTQKVIEHLNYLADDSLEGRGVGTSGESLAADYIVEQLRGIGLQSLMANNAYKQKIPMHSSMPLSSSKLVLYTKSDTLKLSLNEDYFLYKSGAQTFHPTPVPLVFVGYGIIAPEFDYNDYQTVDVRNKIVVCFDGEPKSSDTHYFAGHEPTVYSTAEAKQRLAISKGAIGSIIIPLNYKDFNMYWQKQSRVFSFEDVSLASRVSGHLSLLLHRAIVPSLFKEAPLSWEEVNQLKEDHAMYSFPLNTRLSFRGEFKEREFIASNVIGVLHGAETNLDEPYVVVSSHFDHLGVGLPVKGDSIYNGAIDNAIGVAATLEIARTLKRTSRSLLRSVIFLFVTAEEKGLLGSRYYLSHSPLPHYKIAANINIDGIAIFDRFNSVVGVGKNYSELGDILVAMAEKYGMYATDVPAQFLSFESFARSDQMAFAQAGIPSILIMDGLDYENLTTMEGLKRWQNWIDKRYHTPTDDLNQPIDYRAVEQHVQFLYDYIVRVANHNQSIQWNEDAPFINIRLQSQAEKR
ncbi:MAG: M20/M25/M40 family metallo-hydrolase [Caldithrix sp.]|nr:M20/M25/M40 family metallo-hydrolase [Caldithrix sp.]